jgi:hypothetical protein
VNFNRWMSLSYCTINQSFIQSVIALRHDVDRSPNYALKTAQIEHDLGIRGSYYFRIVPESFDAGIIERIAELGHEIGYHYEDVDLAVRGQTTKVKRETGNGTIGYQWQT